MSTAVLGVKDLGMVQEELYDARTNWSNLGLSLRLNIITLDTIREQYSGDPKKCFPEMLKAYLKTTTPPPSWIALVEALKTKPVAEYHLAEELERKHCREIPRLPGMLIRDFIVYLSICYYSNMV